MAQQESLTSLTLFKTQNLLMNFVLFIPFSLPFFISKNPSMHPMYVPFQPCDIMHLGVHNGLQPSNNLKQHLPFRKCIVNLLAMMVVLLIQKTNIFVPLSLRLASNFSWKRQRRIWSLTIFLHSRTLLHFRPQLPILSFLVLYPLP